jgi:hypothetical protein
MTMSQRRSYYIKTVGWGKEMRFFSSVYEFKKPHGKMWLIILLTGSNGVLWLGAILHKTLRTMKNLTVLVSVTIWFIWPKQDPGNIATVQSTSHHSVRLSCWINNAQHTLNAVDWPKHWNWDLLRLAPIHGEKERKKYDVCNNNGRARKVERTSTYRMNFSPIELVKSV